MTNGEEITDEEFSSVVFLIMQTPTKTGYLTQSICTGTFVNDSQLITAGHCVEGLNSEEPELYFVRAEGLTEDGLPDYRPVAKADNFIRHPKYSIKLNNGVNRYDLSIVNFPEGTAYEYSDIATQTPETGAALTIVGYGNNQHYATSSGEFVGSGAGIKRFGENVIHATSEGFISFVGVPEAMPEVAEGQLVASGSGDSGGPMFVNGELVGVTSGGGLAETEDGLIVSISHYVDLNSESSKSFMAAHLK